VKRLITLLPALFTLTALSQVANNKIENRFRLTIDDWFKSSTRLANVEWDCVNKALTNKCLIYHNDQWFTVTPTDSGSYFINIRQQNCKNSQGVQIVVLEGDPCKTETYSLKECISYTDQSDMFVRLDSLQSGRDYLINIDGYLGDQCDFEIQFSKTYAGTPAKPKNYALFEVASSQNDSIVTLTWALPDSLFFQLDRFLIYRKHEKETASVPIGTIPLFRNALGTSEKYFEKVDTLKNPGSYEYKIFGAMHDDLMLLSTETLRFQPNQRQYKSSSFTAEIEYKSYRSGLVMVHVANDSSGEVLFSTNRTVEEGKNSIVLNLSPYVSKGVEFFKIIISNKGVREERKLRVEK
jgi:hypothetical protein